ncbi:hypothetical protein [Cryobacterium breve]|uniref:hypothetical protein n=1 Tax=Cryobacterium breve TaxID=1259258 RepID=UPI0032B2D6B9
MAKRNVTAAASQYCPMMTAPMAATATNRSIPMTFAHSARAAVITMWVPATMAAATIRMFPTMSVRAI